MSQTSEHTCGVEGCDACERDDALSEHLNAAGLGAIDYRIGTYGRFRRRMEGWISRQVVPPGEPTSTSRPLAALTTRASDDPTLALIDAWACALDVLTFYQERIANEGFLRTATERRSVLELAREIGYALGPGVAASTRLAFTLLDTPKAPEEVTLPLGLQVLSVPGPGETPQTFETTEEVLARPEWNAMVAAQRQDNELVIGSDVLYVAGLATGLKLGDKVLVVGQERIDLATSNVWDARTVVAMELDRDHKVTVLHLDEGLGWLNPFNSGDIEPAEAPRLFVFAKRANVFGHSAPDARMFDADYRTLLSTDPVLIDSATYEWLNFTVNESASSKVVHLVGEHPEVIKDGWVILEDAGYVELYRVVKNEVSARADFGLALKTTRLTLDTNTNLYRFEPRSASVHIASRELTLTTKPIDVAIEGDQIVLEGTVPLLDEGRAVFVVGPPHEAAEDAEDQVELAFIAQALDETRYGALRTVLYLDTALSGSFDRARTQVLGNVALATHGKTVGKEVMGSGDGGKPFQAFKLRQSPVTWVSGESGLASTLIVRVGGVAWTGVGSTYGMGPDDRVFVPRIDDDGVTTVVFGDGQHGARLPTGVENILATYRAGLGAAGAVGAGALTILKTRPMGVKKVTNPEAAEGAEDPETLEDARLNAPVTVLTLDRLVSVSDYEAYARAYPGIGKAQSVRLWDGRRWWVHLTLATAEGATLTSGDPLYSSLVADIHRRRDPVQRVLFDTFQARRFHLRGTVRINPDYISEDVLAAIRVSLLDAFRFERRAFGQAVSGAEILQLCQAVPGVVAVDLDALWDPDASPTPPLTQQSPGAWVLGASAAHWSGVAVRAELLLLDPALEAVDLQEKLP
jgi:hypothetical protein